jgi:acetoin utilization deacetylase AcuC-like enzyme
MLAFCSHPKLVEHGTGPHHPERSDRLRAIHKAVRQAGLIDSPDPYPDFKLDFGPLPQASQKLIEMPLPEAADEKLTSLVHFPGYLERIKQVCAAGGGVLDQADTPVSANGLEMGLLSLGCAIQACDAVMSGKAQRAFSAARPPGHHAEPDRPMGFCIFSNIAIAARYIQKTYGLERIAIVDFDVHHGNGTQAAFEDDCSVLFISLHQHPRTLYPGSGYDYEVGEGPGRGFTMNLPLQPGSGDDEYRRVLEMRVLPKLDDFKPQLLLISAGFDAHAEDPLAHMNVTDDGFELLTRILVGSAKTHCDGKIVSLLEGGYNLRALGRSVVRHLMGLQH